MRKIKNIVMMILVFFLIGTLTFTMFSIRNNSGAGFNSDFGKMDFSGEKPEMPDEEMGEMPNGEMGEVPEMPNGEMGEVPEMPNGEGGEVPEMPNGEMDAIPEMPSGENGEIEEIEEFQNGMNGMGTIDDPGDMPKNGSILKIQHYILFVLQCLLLSGLVLYLVFSKFNAKTFKETFVSGKRILVYSVSCIALTAVLTVGCVVLSNVLVMNQMRDTMEEMPTGEMADGMQKGGMTSETVEYAGAETISEDTEITEGTFTSDTVDENAILVTGNIDVSLSGITVEKTGDSDGGDNSSFYGNNSGIIAKDGAQLTIKNIDVTTNARGANGVFSYGGSATTNNASSDGTTVTIADSTITTTGDNAGGIMTTGGGTTYASNLTINTKGISSAAIRTDRGGTVTVDGGTYATTGAGSPAVYSTAEISVKNASLISKAAEGVVIEGKNSVVLNNCDLTDNNTDLNGLSTTYKNIFLYQSMSGDADSGNSEFTAESCDITTNNGDTFYITNTEATISLINNTIVNNDPEGNFLRAQADSWGTEGANGGIVTLVLDSQEAIGNITIDSVSELDMTMKDSYFEGTINGDDSAKNIVLTLDESSKIKLTGDSYVTALECEDESYSNIDFNGYKLYINGVAIN